MKIRLKILLSLMFVLQYAYSQSIVKLNSFDNIILTDVEKSGNYLYVSGFTQSPANLKVS